MERPIPMHLRGHYVRLLEEVTDSVVANPIGRGTTRNTDSTAAVEAKEKLKTAIGSLREGGAMPKQLLSEAYLKLFDANHAPYSKMGEFSPAIIPVVQKMHELHGKGLVNSRRLKAVLDALRKKGGPFYLRHEKMLTAFALGKITKAKLSKITRNAKAKWAKPYTPTG